MNSKSNQLNSVRRPIWRVALWIVDVLAGVLLSVVAASIAAWSGWWVSGPHVWERQQDMLFRWEELEAVYRFHSDPGSTVECTSTVLIGWPLHWLELEVDHAPLPQQPGTITISRSYLSPSVIFETPDRIATRPLSLAVNLIVTTLCWLGLRASALHIWKARRGAIRA